MVSVKNITIKNYENARKAAEEFLHHHSFPSPPQFPLNYDAEKRRDNLNRNQGFDWEYEGKAFEEKFIFNSKQSRFVDCMVQHGFIEHPVITEYIYAVEKIIEVFF